MNLFRRRQGHGAYLLRGPHFQAQPERRRAAEANQYLKLQTTLLNEKSRIEAGLSDINRVLGGDVVGPAPVATSKRRWCQKVLRCHQGGDGGRSEGQVGEDQG